MNVTNKETQRLIFEKSNLAPVMQLVIINIAKG